MNTEINQVDFEETQTDMQSNLLREIKSLLDGNQESNNFPSIDNLDRWKTLEDFTNIHKQFQQGQMRWLLRHRKSNGLDSAIRKVGKKIYIHEILFANWVINHE